MCRAHQTECFFPGGVRPQSAARPGRRRQATEARGALSAARPGADPTSQTGLLGGLSAGLRQGSALQSRSDDSPLALDSGDDEHSNLHIVGPAVTNDSQILSDYLSKIPGVRRSTRVAIPVPASRSRPVLFTMVQKRPVGLSADCSPGAMKLEMIEKLLEPHNEEVMNM